MVRSLFPLFFSLFLSLSRSSKVEKDGERAKRSPIQWDGVSAKSYAFCSRNVENERSGCLAKYSLGDACEINQIEIEARMFASEPNIGTATTTIALFTIFTPITQHILF